MAGVPEAKIATGYDRGGDGKLVGKELEADIIVTATGFTLQMMGGAQLVVDGQVVRLSEKMTYKGMMLSDVPNSAFTIGYTNSSWTLKIGDGVSTYNALPKLYDGTLEFSDLTSAVDAALAAVDDAQDAATNASQSNANTIGYTQQALDASTAALANQQLARDYAVGPPGTVLPTGGDSAAVSAGKAASTAEETRFIPIHPTPMTANATFAAGDLFQERDCTAAGLVTLTIPAGIFASADQKKAWALLRLRTATGSLKVQGSTGSDLQAPPIKKTGFFGFRNPTIPGTGATIVGTAGAIPAITAGRLLLIVDGLWNVSSGNTLTVSSDSGLTWTARRAQPDPATPNLVPSWSVFDAPLTAFAGGDVVITLDPGLNGQFVGCYWIALEGTVAGAPSRRPSMQGTTMAGTSGKWSAR